LSVTLPGTWELLSRIDVTEAGVIQPEPDLGQDPVALLIYDRAGHFAAQFMKRDRSAADLIASGRTGANNSRAVGGYDAYFGTYVVDDDNNTVTQRLLGSLSPENVGLTLTQEMVVAGDQLVISLRTTVAGEAVTRTLTWRRVG
jgi:hypothetical protein